MKWWIVAYAFGAAVLIAFVVWAPRPSVASFRVRREAAVASWATSVGIVAPVVVCEESHTLGNDDRCVLAVRAMDGAIGLRGLRCDIAGDVAACRFEVTP